MPEIKYQKRKIAYELKLKNPLSFFIEKEVIKDFPDITIYVEKIYRNFNLKNISITKREGDSVIYLKAEKGKIFYNKEKNQIFFILENGNLLTGKGDVINTLDFKNYIFSIQLPMGFKGTEIPRKIQEMDLIGLKRTKGIDSSIEFHKRWVFSITPLIFLLLGSGIGFNLKQKNRIMYIGIGGFIGIIFYEFLILGEIIVRKTGYSFFIYLPVLVFLLLVRKYWK